jgi:hypothetical protein
VLDKMPVQYKESIFSGWENDMAPIVKKRFGTNKPLQIQDDLEIY